MNECSLCGVLVTHGHGVHGGVYLLCESCYQVEVVGADRPLDKYEEV